METVFIYVLIDPISNQIRYVGKTTNIKRRVQRHINERFLHDSYKDRWIRKLINDNFYPEQISVANNFYKGKNLLKNFYQKACRESVYLRG